MSLQYFNTTEFTAFSLSPFDSDALGNLTVMEHVVGTLVKYGGGARYEPFLASQWSSSSDGRLWDFTLKEGLTDEHGDPITAERYAQGLAKILFHLSKKDPSLPVFENLTGWKPFCKNGNLSTLSGIQTPGPHQLRFSFDRKPDGFLEYLAMPYYGFYSLDDFDETGAWKSPHSITSSGAFRVASISPNEVILGKRKGWFSHVNESAAQVVIKNAAYEKALSEAGAHAIIFHKPSRVSPAPSGFRQVSATPTILNALVLSPWIKNFFHDPENRKLFYTRLREAQKTLEPDFPNASFSEFFYPLSKSSLPEVASAYSSFKPVGNAPVKISVSSTLTPPEKHYARQLLRRVFESDAKGNHSSTPIEFIDEDRTKTGWLEEARSNRAFDIRMARVDIGGNIENWGIKMMFCSNLGVGFPDASGKLCALVTEQEQKPALHELDDNYVRRFNEILHEELTVVPLWHSSLSWLFSEKVGLDNFSPTMTFPRFDQLILR